MLEVQKFVEDPCMWPHHDTPDPKLPVLSHICSRMGLWLYLWQEDGSCREFEKVAGGH